MKQTYTKATFSFFFGEDKYQLYSSDTVYDTSAYDYLHISDSGFDKTEGAETTIIITSGDYDPVEFIIVYTNPKFELKDSATTQEDLEDLEQKDAVTISAEEEDSNKAPEQRDENSDEISNEEIVSEDPEETEDDIQDETQEKDEEKSEDEIQDETTGKDESEDESKDEEADERNSYEIDIPEKD